MNDFTRIADDMANRIFDRIEKDGTLIRQSIAEEIRRELMVHFGAPVPSVEPKPEKCTTVPGSIPNNEYMKAYIDSLRPRVSPSEKERDWIETHRKYRELDRRFLKGAIIK